MTEVAICPNCALPLAQERKTRGARVDLMACGARFSAHYELHCKRVAVARLRARNEELEQRLARVAELSHDRDDDSHEKRSRRLGQCASLSWDHMEESFSKDPLKRRSTLKWAHLAAQLTKAESELPIARRTGAQAALLKLREMLIPNHPDNLGVFGCIDTLNELLMREDYPYPAFVPYQQRIDDLEAALAATRPLAPGEVAREDLPQLEACAELVHRLHQHGPTLSNRNRIELLGHWVESRKAEQAKVVT